MLQDPKWVPDLCMRIPMCGRFSLIFVGNSSSQWPRSPAQCHSQERWDGPLVNIEKTIENGTLIVDLPWFTYENSDVPVRKLLVYQRFIATKKLVKSDLKIGGSAQKMSRQNRFGNPKLRVLDENSRNQFWDARKNWTFPFFWKENIFFLQIENRNLVRGFPFYHFGLAVIHNWLGYCQHHRRCFYAVNCRSWLSP